MRISDWSSDVCSSDLVARPDGERLPPYRPGQFISVGIGDLQETRSYSLIGPALEISERYRIAVREEPLGAVSRKMRALKVGETLLATIPAGRFTLPLHPAPPHIGRQTCRERVCQYV